jgi:hypothetical protein
MMQWHMRASVLLLVLSATLSAAAQSFPLGSDALGPAPGERTRVAAAAHADGYVVAWVDQRVRSNDVYVARLNARGELLDREGVRLLPAARTTTGDGPVVASDGKDAVVVWRSYFDPGGIHSARVGADEVTPARSIGSGLPVAMGWSGRHYILLFGDYDGSLHAVLLDREGQPASGVLQLSASWRRASIACGDGNCFVAFAGPEGVRGGTIGEALFPRTGDTAAAVLPRLFQGYDVSVGVDGEGYYSVERASYKLTVRRHPLSRRTGAAGPSWAARLPADALRSQYSVPVPPGGGGTCQTVARDGAVYVTCRSGYFGDQVELLRVTRSGAESLAPPDPARLHDSLALTPGPAGLTVFWGDDRYRHWTVSFTTEPRLQIYAAPLDGEAWRRGGTLVSSSRAREVKPHIARGQSSFLATWVEERLDAELYGAVLDATGRPLGAPFLLARAPYIDEALAEFDGERFLVVWRTLEGNPNDFDSRSLHGRFVEPHGAAAEPFTIAEGSAGFATSLLWNGFEYLAGVNRGVERLSASGEMLGLAWDSFDSVQLAYDADTHEYTGLGSDYEGTVIAAGPLWFVGYTPIRASGHLDPACCPGTRFFTAFYGTAPAVAAGGGHSIAIVAEAGFASGLRIAPDWALLPYPPVGGDRRLQALWRGGEFVVAAGKTLARHAPDGTLLGTQSLGTDVAESAIAIGGATSIIAVVQRGDYALQADRGHDPVALQQVEVQRVTVPRVP